MNKVKVRYCKKCEQYTKQKLISTESQLKDENMLPRIIASIYTLGLLELIDRTKFYECTKCCAIYKEE